jgi:hypothetical protein
VFSGMVLACLCRMIGGMGRVPVSDLGVMGSLFVVAFFMVLGGLPVVLGCFFVMFGCRYMVSRARMPICHCIFS